MSRIALASLVALLTSNAVAEQKTVVIAGTWDSTYGEVQLTQQGNRIKGVYPCCGGGTLEGRIIENRVVKFHWVEPQGAGEGDGIWHLRGGKLEGSWGRGQSETDGGTWNLWRPNQQSIAN